MNAVHPEMFEALFNQSPSPVSVVKADAPAFTIIAFNELYKKESRTAVDDIIGKPTFDVYKPWDEASEKQFALLKRSFIQAIAEKKPINLPALFFEWPTEDGLSVERSWWQIKITPVFNTQGEVEYLMAVTQNITDQEHLRLKADNDKEQLINEELQAINEELASTNEELTATVEELNLSQEKLFHLNRDLEARITARTAELTASEKRYKLMLDALPQIAWTSVPNVGVTYFNKRWYDYTGLSYEQSKASGWSNAIHPDDLQYSIDSYKSIVATQQPGEFEIREKRADGVYRWHMLRIQPVRKEDGSIEQWIGTATDIDDLKQLQQQKDDFISIASHELKTPITSLKASLQLMDKMKDNPSKEILPKLILQSRKSIQRVSTLVEDLLNVNRLQHGEIYLNKSNFILSQLLNSICNPISIMGKQKIHIKGELELEVYADEHRIDQVVTNLVNNAVKYAPESESITLAIEKTEGFVTVSVIDQGQGIPKDKIPHLFDRYFRVDSSGYQASGLGLGLYISADIIKRHGGEIGVKSEPGQGSTFWFTMPL